MLQNLKNMGQMAGQANQVRQQQQKLQKLLQEVRVTGQSKNEKVSITITGEQKIVDVYTDPSLIKFVNETFFGVEFDDPEKQKKEHERGQKFLSTPFIQAFEDALSKVQTEVVRKLQETGSMEDLQAMLGAASGGQGK